MSAWHLAKAEGPLEGGAAASEQQVEAPRTEALKSDRPKSLKDAISMQTPGWDFDLEEVISPRDRRPAPPPIDFSLPEYRD